MRGGPPPVWVKRTLRIMGGTLGRVVILVVFLASLLIGAVSHLNLNVSRRVAAQIVIGPISDMFRGTIQVRSFTRLERTGIAVDEVVVLDPEGRTTLTIGELSVDVDVFSILERVFSKSEKLSIEIERVDASDCEVSLLPTTERDEKGELFSYPSIADAFSPVETGASTSSKKGRPVRVWFPRIMLRNVHARGSVAGSPILDAQVRSARASVLATDKGATVDVNRFHMKVSGVGGVDTRAHGEVHIRAPGAIWGDVQGLFGQVPVKQAFRYENGSIDVKGEFPSLKPEALRPLLGTWPLDEAISVQNQIKGTPPTLTATAEIRPVKGNSSPTLAFGVLRLKPSLSLDVKVVTKDLNLKDHLSTLPSSSLDSDVQVRIRPEQTGVTAVFEGKLAAGSIAGESTPAAQITGKFAPDGLVVDGQFIEPGLSAKVRASHSSETGSKLTALIEHLDIGVNERARRYSGGTSGKIAGSVVATLKKDDTFETSAALTLENFRRDTVSFSRAYLKGNAQGSVASPLKSQGTVSLDLGRAELGPVIIRSGSVQASGPLLTPQIKLAAETEQGLNLVATTRARLDKTEFTGISAAITGKGEAIEATAERLSLAQSRVVVQKLVVRSIGEIRADLDFGPGGGKIDLEAENLSLSRIAANLGMPRNEFGGELNANVHLLVGAHSEGTIDIEMTNGALMGIDDVSLDAHATIEGTATRGNINGRVASLGDIESSWEGEIKGPLHVPSTYAKATGQARAQIRNLDLKALSLLLGKGLGVPESSGALSARLEIQRHSAAEFPSFELNFDTKSLTVPVETEARNILVEGLDVQGALSGRPDEELLEGVVRLNDRYGTLVSLSASLELPLRSWGSDLPDLVHLREEIETASLSAVLVAPRRRLDRIPGFLEIPLETGNVTVRASASGTLRSPRLTVTVDANRLDGPASPFSRPVDVDFNSSYAPLSGDLRGSFALTSDGTQVGSGQLDVLLPLAHLSSPLGERVPIWTGSASVQLDNAELSLIKELKTRKMRGAAQGIISVERNGWEPQLNSEVRLRDLEFGGNQLGDALVETQTYESDLVARAQFTDDYGLLQVTAEAGVVPTPWLLDFAEQKPIYLSLQAERFDAAIAHPFLADVLDELSGSLNGRLKAEWTPPPKTGGEWRASISGNMRMKEGVITPSVLGVRLEEAQMTMTAAEEGAMNVIRVRDISARAASDHHNLKGDAVLFFDSLSLSGGTFHLSPEDVPLKSNDVELARLTGTAQGRFDMTGQTTRLELKINNMEARLPEASKSNLFALDENPTIEVLQRPVAEKEKSEEQKTSATELKFILGDNVRLKSELLDIKLRGEPQMRIDDELEMRGALQLIPGGRILVLGRRFIVEEGTVLFDTADAADPHLSVAAAWSAPGGVRVRVTVGGTARAPQLSWSSEPALPGGEAEVIALVLGGGGGSSTDQGQASITSGIAFAANEALGQTGTDRIQFYTTQETSGTDGRVASLNDSSWESYTATYRISDELWFEGSYEQSSGAGPQTTRSGVSGTLDWRFHQHWSLRSEFGTLGAGLDLVWRYRY